MKKNYVAFAPALISFGLLLILTGCIDILEPPVPEEKDPAKKGIRITVSDGRTAARTLLPENPPTFTKYILKFKEDNDNATHGDITITGGNFKLLEDLDEGNWTITAEGYADVGGSDVLVATGKKEFPYTGGEDTLTIDISPVGAADGTFKYKIIAPIDVNYEIDSSFILMRTFPGLSLISKNPTGMGDEQSVSLAPGNYFMTVRLEKFDGAYATDTQIVQIYPAMVTAYERTFNDSDFSEWLPITPGALGITKPVTGEGPDKTATFTGTGWHTGGTITWVADGGTGTPTPGWDSDDEFEAEIVYKATVTLNAEQGYRFNYTGAAVWSISGDANAQVTPGTNTGDTLVITVAFPETEGAPLTSAPVTVGDDTQDVTVTASTGATVAYIPGGYRVVTTANYGPFAWFTVDLGTDKSITDFEKVTFDYNAVEGDVGNKTLYLLASDETFPGTMNNNYTPLRVSGYNWNKGPGSESLTAIIGKNDGNNLSQLPSADGEINFSFYLHAEAATYEISNIVFVPLPEGHIPVDEINGVPDVGQVGVEVNLTTATAGPSGATNKTIVWSLNDPGTTGVTEVEVATGKFIPALVGTITVTATIENGATPTTPYTKDFEIGIRLPTPATGKPIPLENMGGDYTGTLDGDGLGFTVSGGANYQWAAATFDLDLGSATLKDVVKVTFNYTRISGDTNFKNIGIVAGSTAIPGGNLADAALGTVASGDATENIGKPLEIVLNYTRAKAITGSTVVIGFFVQAPSDANFTIDNIKFFVAE
jgi:hypothetical protein